MGGAYLIFSLALLVDTFPKIIEKAFIGGRIVHSSFVICLVIMLLLSIRIIITNESLDPDWLYLISKIVIIFMSVDCIFLWIFKESNHYDDLESPNKEISEVFEKNLFSGVLGEIEKGEEE